MRATIHWGGEAIPGTEVAILKDLAHFLKWREVIRTFSIHPAVQDENWDNGLVRPQLGWTTWLCTLPSYPNTLRMDLSLWFLFLAFPYATSLSVLWPPHAYHAHTHTCTCTHWGTVLTPLSFISTLRQRLGGGRECRKKCGMSCVFSLQHWLHVICWKWTELICPNSKSKKMGRKASLGL